MIKPFHIAFRELGVKEIAGAANNERILEYHNCVRGGFNSDEIAWCSSFVNFAFMVAGDDTRTKSAASQSWIHWGVETKEPKLGDLVVFTNKKNPAFGHVGFYIDQIENAILVLGGNQKNSVSVQWYYKNGDTLRLNRFLTWQ